MNRQRRRARKRGGGRPAGRSWMIWTGVAGALAVVLLVVLFWGGPSGAGIETSIELPTWVRARSRSVQTAYVYAVERPDVLAWMPCYCGCGDSAGHQNNEHCFVGSRHADGRVVFDSHGAT